MMSQLVFMFFCLLIAKGWTITTSHLDQAIVLQGRFEIALHLRKQVSMVVMIILYLSLFIWDFVGRDPASTIYFWDSAVGAWQLM